MKQVLYISEATQFMTPEDLEELLAESVAGNKVHSITGVLIFIYNRFIQCIEGSEAEIDQLVTNIRKDSRNKNVVVLRDRQTDSRSFGGWSMGFMNYRDDTTTFGPAFFRITDLNDLKHIEDLDEEIFQLMSSFYRS